jgi:AcrR family transcriptional regulator
VSVENRRRRPRQKGPGRPRQTDSEVTRTRLLETARRSFALNGFADTPVSALAEEAGVTAGTLYYYFGSKIGLYEAVATEARKRLNESLIDPVLAITSGQPTLESRLTTLVNVLAHRAAEDIGLHRLGFAGDLEAEHFPAVKTFRDGIRGDLRRLYAGVAGFPLSDDLTTDQKEIIGFIELLTLGTWHFAIRPGGLERLPVFVQAFDALLSDTLFTDAKAGKAAR